MKLTVSSPVLKAACVLLTAALTSVVVADACGPYNPIIPTPSFFASTWSGKSAGDCERAENLHLWQELTSADIPLPDIEAAVYGDSSRTVEDIIGGATCGDNRFYTYLRKHGGMDILQFLADAKAVQELRERKQSAWYHPAERTGGAPDRDYDEIIARCRGYKGTRLRDRYGLQLTRALFAARRYEECIKEFGKVFGDIPDSNLFKRMATGYVAGCWSRLGDVDKANEYFASTGDFNSIVADNAVEYMALRNPDSRRLMEHVQKISSDSAAFSAIAPAVEAILKGNLTGHRGDWEFYMAYLDGNYRGDTAGARRHITRALGEEFSSADFRDHARAYKMLLDADADDRSNLYDDLKWIEMKVNPFTSEGYEWNRILQNIVFAHWVPVLWKNGDYAEAIMLCGYADNLYEKLNDEPLIPGYWQPLFTPLDAGLDENSPVKPEHRHDYAGMTFQLMGSLPAARLAEAREKIEASDLPLAAFLKRYAVTDADYFNELIGTLALREENYDMAMDYLSRVGLGYQRSMNVYPYLDRNPFVNYPDRWRKNGYEGYEWEYECSWDGYVPDSYDPDNAKLRFAREMKTLKQQMENGGTADMRGLAKLRYALGVRNSFEQCWPLTQYWRGMVPDRFTPQLDYREDDYHKLDFLYDYSGHNEVWARGGREIAEALDSLTTDEARAEAELLLGHRAAVVRKYAGTAAAARVRASCDNWRNWL